VCLVPTRSQSLRSKRSGESEPLLAASPEGPLSQKPGLRGALFAFYCEILVANELAAPQRRSHRPDVIRADNAEDICVTYPNCGDTRHRQKHISAGIVHFRQRMRRVRKDDQLRIMRDRSGHLVAFSSSRVELVQGEVRPETV
jgi:hypothetical protein